MSTPQNDGICYLCGNTIKKSGMTTHLRKEICPEGNIQRCTLLKVEDQYSKNYWLYLDIPATSALSTLDRFLRNIWLECCGHMSQFYLPDDQVVGKTNRISILSRGKKLCYDYDFGTPTSLVITSMGYLYRPAQRSAVRLLARNTPPVFPCKECANPSDWVDVEHDPKAFYCEECMKNREEGGYLPVTNSPRMGECGYCGQLDKYAYVPKPRGSAEKSAGKAKEILQNPQKIGTAPLANGRRICYNL